MRKSKTTKNALNCHNFLNICPIFNPKPPLESLETQHWSWTVRHDLAIASAPLLGILRYSYQLASWVSSLGSIDKALRSQWNVPIEHFWPRDFALWPWPTNLTYISLHLTSIPKFKSICLSVQPWEWDGPTHRHTHRDDVKTVRPVTSETWGVINTLRIRKRPLSAHIEIHLKLHIHVFFFVVVSQLKTTLWMMVLIS